MAKGYGTPDAPPQSRQRAQLVLQNGLRGAPAVPTTCGCRRGAPGASGASAPQPRPAAIAWQRTKRRPADAGAAGILGSSALLVTAPTRAVLMPATLLNRRFEIGPWQVA